MTPDLRTLSADAPPDAGLLEDAVHALAAGELVALPTETVYGLAARADDPRALARLSALKGRDPARPFTWHAPDAGAVLAAGPRPLAVVARVAARYWPGPLTLVLDAAPAGLAAVARDGWTGVRVPAHEGTRALLAACDFPVVASSANPTGDMPLLEAGAVARAFGDDLALVLDGGRSRLGEASAVLALGPGRFEVLREGLVDADDLRAAAGLSILFVCTGNTCRSPMAEVLARAVLRARLGGADPADFGFHVASAGVFAGGAAPPSPEAVEAMALQHLDLTGHASRPALPAEVSASDRVYCLTADHRAALLADLPPGAGDHIELLDPAGRDVTDPIGGTREDYRACARAIRAAIETRADTWA